MSLRIALEQRLTQIQGLTRHPASKGPGYAYFAGSQEIAHFHGDERIDVRLTRNQIRQRISERPFDEGVTTRGPSADWVAVRISKEQDLSVAVSLVEESLQVHRHTGEK
jgi:Family of unknown function (DUF5519)